MSKRPYFLLSLYEKDPHRDWVQRLRDQGDYRFLGTDGTARWCEQLGIHCETIDDVVGLQPRLGGKVKTLHSDLYTGILAASREDCPPDIPFVRGVAVDLTPLVNEGAFQPEKVDIGGISLLRAAVKNHRNVWPVCSPECAREMFDRTITEDKRRENMARQTLRRTLRYDKTFLARIDPAVRPGGLSERGSFPSVKQLRYGENPDQKASWHVDVFQRDDPIPWTLLAGDELSYTNVLDLEAARRLTASGEAMEVTTVKHTNPTGWARGPRPAEVIRRSWEGDPKSAFGGVMGMNREVTPGMLTELEDCFVEAIVAPDFKPGAVEAVRGEERPRLVRWEAKWGKLPSEEIHSLTSGYLRQSLKWSEPDREGVVTERRPSDGQWEAMQRMWRLCRWVSSNAAVIGTLDQVLGVGAGQQSRVDAVKLAVEKFRQFHEPPSGPLAMASDGFFPFPDSVERAAEAGVQAIIVPGGSIRDPEVIEAANRLDVAMVFTGRRAFSH